MNVIEKGGQKNKQIFCHLDVIIFSILSLKVLLFSIESLIRFF